MRLGSPVPQLFFHGNLDIGISRCEPQLILVFPSHRNRWMQLIAEKASPMMTKSTAMPATLAHLDSFSLETLLRDSPVPVLVDFWAPWCGPCKAMAPVLEDLAREYEGKITIVKLDINDEPEAANRYRIQSIPTLMLFDQGQVLSRTVGALSRPALERELTKHLA